MCASSCVHCSYLFCFLFEHSFENNNLAGILLTDINDLNNVITPGNYYAYGSNTISHKPAGVGAFAVEVYKSAGSYIGQRLTDVNDIHLRTYNGSAWSDWEGYTKKADLNTKVNKADNHNIAIGYDAAKKALSVTLDGVYIGNCTIAK